MPENAIKGLTKLDSPMSLNGKLKGKLGFDKANFKTTKIDKVTEVI